MSTIAAPAPRRSGARRWIIRFVVAVIALNLITLVGARLLRSPGGPTSSSFATASDGLAAYAELLTRSGHPVSRLRSAPADARLDPRTTLVVLDPSAVLPADAAALRRFVAGGGRLVAGGSDPVWVRDLLTRPPLWSANAPTRSSCGPASRAARSRGDSVRSGSAASPRRSTRWPTAAARRSSATWRRRAAAGAR